MESSPLPSGAGWRLGSGCRRRPARRPVRTAARRREVASRGWIIPASESATSSRRAFAFGIFAFDDDALQLARAVEPANERLFGRVGRHLLQAQHRVGAERDVLALVAGQHRLLPGLVVVTSNSLQDQRGGRPLETRRAGGHLLARP